MGARGLTFLVNMLLALGLVGTAAGSVAGLARRAFVNPHPSAYGFDKRHVVADSLALLALGVVGALVLLATGNWRVQ